jgi:serine/threonine protein kinase
MAPDPSSPLVLVIDDEPQNRSFLATRLQRDGYRVITAATGAEGLQLLDEEPVSLVLLDMEMPQMNGLVVLEKMRQRPQPRIPVLMVSGNTEVERKVDAIELGADDYLPKPIEYAFLRAKLKQHLLRTPSLDSGDPQPGQHFAHYVLEEEIGQGGMARVFRALDVRLQRQVALKLMLPSGRSSIARFLREARAIAAVEHPNLVRIYEVSETPKPYIAMELVDGEELPRQSASREVALRWIAEAADTLHQVHQKGILHRDLKPSNIMLTRQGGLKLLDFGLAKLTAVDERLTQSGEIWGTPQYMAPEHFDPERGGVDAQSDVYALGVILYELLSGRLPYRQDSLGVLLADILHAPVPACPNVPAAVDEVCRKALAKQKSQRYQDAASFAADLRRLLAAGVATSQQ